MSKTNEKKVWLVTGASRGIGAEIVEAALAAGDTVVATARNPETIRRRFGDRERLLAITLDVTDEVSIAGAVEAAIGKVGRIDVLVNNAGYGVVGAIEETSAADVRRIYETNVFGLLSVTRAVLPHMRKQRAGHVLNLSSVGGYASGPGYGIYCSTKFAVEGISEAMHGELAPLGIRVTVIEPGYFRTDFLDGASVVHAATRITDYDATAGQTREVALAKNHQQPGDPAKLARVLVELIRSAEPPVRLALGHDAVAAIEAKNAFVTEEIARWRDVSTSTDIVPQDG